MPTKRKRIYKGKNVDMLTACATIMENAIANQEFLMSKRPAFTHAFFGEVQARINSAFKNHLGVDSAAPLRKATQIVVGFQSQALNDLAELQVQIEEDFKSDKTKRNEIFRTLGYSGYNKKAQNGDQEALIEWLFQFRKSLTDELRDEITGKGTAPQLLESINSYADQLSESNITQETHKGTKKEITGEAVDEFMEIYNQVISIAKIARKFYKGNPDKQNLFSYGRILKNLNASSGSTGE